MSDVDLNKVKAGSYRLLSKFWDEIKSKPGEPFDFTRHRRGDTVELDVEQARRLVKAGAVMSEEDFGNLLEQQDPEPTAVLDAGGIAALREKLDLEDDADQVAILEALELAVKPADQGLSAPASSKIEDILEWVGGDEAKARFALEAEKAKKEPRGTLVEALDELLKAE